MRGPTPECSEQGRHLALRTRIFVAPARWVAHVLSDAPRVRTESADRPDYLSGEPVAHVHDYFLSTR